LRWVERSLGGGARVIGWRRLTGGITASLHRLRVALPSSERPVTVVLRRFLPTSDELARWAAHSVEREAAVLRQLRSTGLPAPTVIAWSSDGRDTGGVPALLMSRVPGRIHLGGRDPSAWLRQMAAMAARIHALRIVAHPWSSWIEPDALTVPRWSSRPDVWRAAIACVRDLPADPPVCFIHGDYQHFNLLWARGRLTGVIDWVNAATGPPDIDVGHCRLNLAVLFSPAWAEELRLAYEAEAGRPVDPRWDVHALLSYDERWAQFIPLQVDGQVAVDLAGMDRRVEAVLAAAVARL
jgi:aminoglycoside phosphotransferase (APT) family kinase protein